MAHYLGIGFVIGIGWHVWSWVSKNIMGIVVKRSGNSEKDVELSQNTLFEGPDLNLWWFWAQAFLSLFFLRDFQGNSRKQNGTDKPEVMKERGDTTEFLYYFKDTFLWTGSAASECTLTINHVSPIFANKK